MRSEVVKIHRYDIDRAMPAGPDPRIASELLSDLCRQIKVGETKSVRISVEIEEEKGEEKVGNDVYLSKRGLDFGAYLGVSRCMVLDPVVADWQPGESRKVKSINFETQSGVPEVIFEETAEQKLARLKNELHDAVAEAYDGDFGTAWTKIYPAFTELVGIVEGK